MLMNGSWGLRRRTGWSVQAWRWGNVTLCTASTVFLLIPRGLSNHHLTNVFTLQPCFWMHCALALEQRADDIAAARIFRWHEPPPFYIHCSANEQSRPYCDFLLSARVIYTGG